MAKKSNEPPKYPEVGARLREFVDASGEPSDRQFAIKAGITSAVLSNLILGYSSPGGETLAAIAAAFPKFDVNYILTGKRAAVSSKEVADQLPPQVPSKFEEAEPGKQIMILSHSLERMLAGMTDAQKAEYWRGRYETDIELANRREKDLLDRLAKKLEASSDAAAPQPVFASYVAAPAARLIGPRFDEPVVLDFYTGQRKAA